MKEKGPGQAEKGAGDMPIESSGKGQELEDENNNSDELEPYSWIILAREARRTTTILTRADQRSGRF
jgi:hypothetical protein